ncbi:MAG: hypothetical protein JXR23_11385 [Pontiellaceae bacterium]|nr:hypothetical protein [Pontiellaceae bacterium]
MIENRVLRNEERDKRLDHRSALNTFTNLFWSAVGRRPAKPLDTAF